MYNKFFGLSEAPFNITPDSRFLYMSQRHREALASLLYGIQHRKGFVLLTGEIGAGKTTVCRSLIHDLHESDIQLAVVFNSYLTEIELLKTINDEFGIDSSGDTKKALIDELNQFLITQNLANNTCVLIIDEAQNLSPEVLEQVRMISNLETENEKLIQIVLMGQPELNDILEMDRLEQLNQRITVRYHLTPLDENEIQKYINHRLNCAQAKIEIEFTDGALRAIYKATKGIPRKINVLCDRILMVAYVASSYCIDEKMVKEAIAEIRKPGSTDLDLEDDAEKSSKRKLSVGQVLQPLMVVCTVVLVFCGIVYGVISYQENSLIPSYDKLSASTLNETAPEEQSTRTLPEPPKETVTDLVDEKEEEAVPTEPPKPKEKKIPVTDEMAWKFDSDGVLRVMNPSYTRQASQLTILGEWNIRPANLTQLKDFDEEMLERLDLLASNMSLGVSWFDTELDLIKAIKFDVPLLLTINAGGQNSLSPYIVLRKVRGEAVTIADPVWGEKIVRRTWLKKQVEAIQVVYIDFAHFGDLLRGEESETVGQLQETLKTQGYYKRKMTKIYDAGTMEAIKRLQRANKLKVTGLLDKPTALLLVSEANENRPTLFPAGGRSL